MNRWGGRTDYPVELPAADGRVEAGPATAAGNCVVLKPAEQTPLSITLLLELIGDLFPAGVLNVVQGFGKEAGEALATSKRIAKLAFTGSTPVGRHILACAAENIIPCTVELGEIAQHLLRRRDGRRRGIY